MIVMSLTDCPPRLRGELTRWLIEIRPHVYVGQVNARVRDQLWEKTCKELAGGSAVQIWNSAAEQSFTARSWGTPDYVLRDFEGITLVERPHDTFKPEVDADAPQDVAAPIH
jgi:CRISPR-associated protein Cas2